VRSTSVVIALALVLNGCAARTTSPAPPEAVKSDGRQTLQTDLQALFANPAYHHASLAVVVSSLVTDETLYSLNGSRLLIPASTQKVLTAAAAAERLGWDYRFATRLFATGTISEGTLEGNLVIVGNGDPTINPRHPERWRVFDDWAEALRARGIRIISGHVIGDDNAIAEPGWGMGWSWDDLKYGFGAPIGALQYNENQIEVVVGPGMASGARAVITTSPAGSGIFVDHRVTTAAPGAEATVEIARVAGTSFLEVRGEVAQDAKPIAIAAAVDNPTLLYLHAFRDALGRHGIAVGGSMLDVDELDTPPTIAGAIELVADRSPPLSEIIDTAMKWSRNGYAETLLHALSPDLPATDTKGLEALRQILSGLGIPPESYIPRDGSGLSRYDFVTAEALAFVLKAIHLNPHHAETFRLTLPVAGVSGTLANRLKGTPAEGRVWAKTGSMSHVRALAGYVMTLDGEWLVVSILANNFRVPPAEIEGLVDSALVRLVQFRR
jgi:D-alanyl-D-alanine carboxypeptidase/D-alanyl-D-alanine-endopeptidase (penicillin-binding protein 4)